MEHTKGKWRQDKHGDSIEGENGKIITIMYPCTLPTDPQSVANARRICQCVNSYDELLETCKIQCENCKHLHPDCDCDECVTGEAIAKAIKS